MLDVRHSGIPFAVTTFLHKASQDQASGSTFAAALAILPAKAASRSYINLNDRPGLRPALRAAYGPACRHSVPLPR